MAKIILQCLFWDDGLSAAFGDLFEIPDRDAIDMWAKQ